MFKLLKKDDEAQKTYEDQIEDGVRAITESFEKLTDVLSGQSELLAKFNRNQSEIAITLSEMRDVMVDEKDVKEEHPEIKKLLSAMVGTADMVEAFYNFTFQSNNQALMTQGEMMWKSLQKKYALAGLVRMSDESTASDSALNQIIATDDLVKEGIIAKTLTSGYTYDGNVIRKSEVIVGTRKGSE